MRIISRKLTISILALAALAVLLTAISIQAAEPKLMAAFFVKGKVGLKWQKMDGVTEYRIYRKSTSGEFELIGTSDEDHYFDLDIVPGTTYNYKIAIVDAGGQEISSAAKTVTIPGEVGEFLPPTWVGIREDQGKILLNWDPVPSAVAYNIYRSTTSGSNYEVVGSSQSSSHADKSDLEVGTTYYYVLTSMNTDFEETAHSEERSVKFGMSKEERDKQLAEQNSLKLEEIKLTHLHDLTRGENSEPMNQPADVYANSKGQIYVTDALNARVNCYDQAGKYLFSFGKDSQGTSGQYENGTFKVPFTIYIDKKDQVYVADIDRNDIQIFAADGTFVRCITVKMEPGMKPLRANGVCPVGDNRLAISDTGNHRLLIIDLDGNIISVKGKRGSGPGEFSFPGEIERSEKNELYLLDVINSRVQVLDLEGNFIREFGGTGEGAGLFGRPSGLALDTKGRVWVSDNMSALVQSFTPEGEVKSIVGTAKDQWHFVAPRGMHFVGDRMYVVDRLSNKVMVFSHG